MPAPELQEYTPVRAARGRRVHAVTLGSPTRTACGRRFSGWAVSPDRMNCRLCKLEILKDRVRRGDAA